MSTPRGNIVFTEAVVTQVSILPSHQLCSLIVIGLISCKTQKSMDMIEAWDG